MAVGIPFYYFSGALFQGKNIVINIVFAAAVAVLFAFFKKRYFEKIEV
jgi:hypothetical protein